MIGSRSRLARARGHFLAIAMLVLALVLGACGGDEANPAAGAEDSADQPATEGVASGGPAEVDNIATYEGEDRQELLEAGAAEEGCLNLYTNPTPDITDALVAAYTEKYPQVEVSITRGGSSELAQRIAEEHSAGLHQVDVVETTSSVLDELQSAGITQPFFTPQAENYADGAVDSDGYYVTSRESHIALGYNTDLVSAEDAPKTYEDLLDPKWKGRMAIPGSATGVRFVANMELEYGEEFLQALSEQDITLQNISGRALADLVVAGEVALSPAIYDSHIAVSSEQGAPVAWQPLEPVIALPTGPSVAAEAPCLHAALLYIDFILSEEGQEIYLDHGYQSARSGLPSGDVDYEKVYLDTRDDYLDRFEEWEGMLQQYFIG